jgi:hypothetical protein
MNSRRTAWSEAHGPIPKGWIVHNLNGNMWDDRLCNLAAIPRKTDNISQVIAPYRARVRRLELQLQNKERS